MVRTVVFLLLLFVSVSSTSLLLKSISRRQSEPELCHAIEGFDCKCSYYRVTCTTDRDLQSTITIMANERGKYQSVELVINGEREYNVYQSTFESIKQLYKPDADNLEFRIKFEKFTELHLRSASVFNGVFPDNLPVNARKHMALEIYNPVVQPHDNPNLFQNLNVDSLELYVLYPFRGTFQQLFHGANIKYLRLSGGDITSDLSQPFTGNVGRLELAKQAASLSVENFPVYPAHELIINAFYVTDFTNDHPPNYSNLKELRIHSQERIPANAFRQFSNIHTLSITTEKEIDPHALDGMDHLEKLTIKDTKPPPELLNSIPNVKEFETNIDKLDERTQCQLIEKLANGQVAIQAIPNERECTCVSAYLDTTSGRFPCDAQNCDQSSCAAIKNNYDALTRTFIAPPAIRRTDGTNALQQREAIVYTAPFQVSHNDQEKLQQAVPQQAHQSSGHETEGQQHQQPHQQSHEPSGHGNEGQQQSHEPSGHGNEGQQQPPQHQSHQPPHEDQQHQQPQQSYQDQQHQQPHENQQYQQPQQSHHDPQHQQPHENQQYQQPQQSHQDSQHQQPHENQQYQQPQQSHYDSQHQQPHEDQQYQYPQQSHQDQQQPHPAYQPSGHENGGQQQSHQQPHEDQQYQQQPGSVTEAGVAKKSRRTKPRIRVTTPINDQSQQAGVHDQQQHGQSYDPSQQQSEHGHHAGSNVPHGETDQQNTGHDHSGSVVPPRDNDNRQDEDGSLNHQGGENNDNRHEGDGSVNHQSGGNNDNRQGGEAGENHPDGHGAGSHHGGDGSEHHNEGDGSAHGKDGADAGSHRGGDGSANGQAEADAGSRHDGDGSTHGQAGAGAESNQGGEGSESHPDSEVAANRPDGEGGHGHPASADPSDTKEAVSTDSTDTTAPAKKGMSWLPIIIIAASIIGLILALLICLFLRKKRASPRYNQAATTEQGAATTAKA